MNRPIPRHALEYYALTLRRNADTAKNTAAHARAAGSTEDADRWIGQHAGLMQAHGLAMGLLTAGREPIVVGDEVAFDWPSHAKPSLTDIDAHYDVIEIRDGMVGVKRTIYRPRAAMQGAVHHWAPLTAVHRVHLDGNLCPTPDQAVTVDGGVR